MYIFHQANFALPLDERLSRPDIDLYMNGLLAQQRGYKPAKPSIPGDLNGDGSVGVADLLILLANWGACDDPDDCPADLDDNGDVGVSDLLILLANWG